MNYEAWRCCHQSPEKACQEAFKEWMYWVKEARKTREDLRQAKLELIAIDTMSYEQLKERAEQVQEQETL